MSIRIISSFRTLATGKISLPPWRTAMKVNLGPVASVESGIVCSNEQLPGWARNYKTAPGRYFSSSLTDEEESKNSAVTSKPMLNSIMGKSFEYHHLDYDVLLSLSAQNDIKAAKELLIRNIMVTDKIEYDDAVQIFSKIDDTNDKFRKTVAYPYFITIGIATFCGLISIPMVFNESTCLWFNERYVTMDIPPPSDLDTFLEVGAWSWNWMEPVMGTAGFVLITAQFVKGQLENIGVGSVTQKFKRIRSEHVMKEFPQYSEHLIVSYSVSKPFF